MTALAEKDVEFKAEVEYGTDRAIRLLLQIAPETWKVNDYTAVGHRVKLTAVATKRVINDREANDSVTLSHRIGADSDLLDWLKSEWLFTGLQALIWRDDERHNLENDDRIALLKALLDLIDQAEQYPDQPSK